MNKKKICQVCGTRIPKKIKRLHFCCDACEIAYYRVHHNLDLRTNAKWKEDKPIHLNVKRS